MIIKLALQDINLNIHYSKSLRKAKIISDGEYKTIKKALSEIHEQIINGKFKFSSDFEDIHMNIEMSLKKKLVRFQESFIQVNQEMTKLQLI